MFAVLFYAILFFALPAILSAFIGIGFYRYRSSKKQNEEVPGTYDAEEIKRRKIILIITCVAAGVHVAVVIGFIGLLFTAVAFM